MRYLGGKSALAKKIVDEIVKRAPDTLYFVEPFMGGAAVTEQLFARRPTLAGDIAPGLVAMYAAIRSGFRLGPVTEESYAALKKRAREGDTSPEVVAVGFGLSFAGKWFRGLARPCPSSPDPVGTFNRWADRFCAACSASRGLYANASHFTAWRAHARPGVTFYADPPYRGAESYTQGGPWNPALFDAEAREWRRRGARVFVSEFEAPFTVVAEFPRKIRVNSGTGQLKIDRLYEVG